MVHVMLFPTIKVLYFPCRASQIYYYYYYYYYYYVNSYFLSLFTTTVERPTLTEVIKWILFRN
jgi:hypothetical protein